MNADFLNSSRLDLLQHAGIYGLCRVRAQAVVDVDVLREVPLVELHDPCLRLTRRGEQHVARVGGKLTARHLH